jgi:hypothetical protein
MYDFKDQMRILQLEIRELIFNLKRKVRRKLKNRVQAFQLKREMRMFTSESRTRTTITYERRLLCRGEVYLISGEDIKTDTVLTKTDAIADLTAHIESLGLRVAFISSRFPVRLIEALQDKKELQPRAIPRVTVTDICTYGAGLSSKEFTVDFLRQMFLRVLSKRRRFLKASTKSVDVIIINDLSAITGSEEEEVTSEILDLLRETAKKNNIYIICTGDTASTEHPDQNMIPHGFTRRRISCFVKDVTSYDFLTNYPMNLYKLEKEPVNMNGYTYSIAPAPCV